ncbi:unnamed protein product [Notodromas monacha]|uniref:Uncharacterized protein n=1 Tax=Notodromas monacha TaxID=399045 RepID=A0A7R9BEH7_9CRUS|nr:unnamed protein product [Notodromas monacha]CAG0912796.1 unnamed protein product [Notodromas monacha]
MENLKEEILKSDHSSDTDSATSSDFAGDLIHLFLANGGELVQMLVSYGAKVNANNASRKRLLVRNSTIICEGAKEQFLHKFKARRKMRSHHRQEDKMPQGKRLDALENMCTQLKHDQTETSLLHLFSDEKFYFGTKRI